MADRNNCPLPFPFDLQIKLFLVGHKYVGKTRFLWQFAPEGLRKYEELTNLGVDFKTRRVRIYDKKGQSADFASGHELHPSNFKRSRRTVKTAHTYILAIEY